MVRPKSADPLIAALIAKLPPPAEAFPADRQKAWLSLMAMALAATYGGEAVRIDEIAAQPTAADAPKPPAQKFKAAKAATSSYPFYVDKEGFARNKAGQRILAAEVSDILYDLRGEAGDPREIVWADDSAGINGRNLDISVVIT